MTQKAAKTLSLMAALVALALLAGCAATTTAIRYQDLKVETQMSDTVFLDPVPPEQRTVYVQVRNTSDQPSFNIQYEVSAAIAAKGYQVVYDPRQAHFWLMANILSVGQTDKSALELAGGAGFGGAIAGAAAGALIARSGSELGGAAIGGIAAGAAEVIAGSMVKVNWFAVITDVEISEASNEGISEETQSNLRQGSSSMVRQSSARSTDRKRFRTRIASSARQVNLTFPEAEPLLRQGLINSISGMF